MALAQGTVWEVRTAGSDSNGGGFNVDRGGGGVDRSQSDTPFVTIDGVTITATVQATTTDLAITGYTTVAADIGNLVNITGGTMTAGVYEITAIPAAGQWRLDRSGGVAAQTGTGRMGGALGSPGFCAGKVVDANLIYVKAGTYLITSTTANIAGGRVSAARGLWVGYQTIRDDLGTAPVFQASGVNTFTIFASGGNELQVVNINVDGNLQVATRGFVPGNRSLWIKCGALNCTNGGFVTGSNVAINLLGCFAQGCTTASAGFDTAAGGAEPFMYGCWATANTVPGFNVLAARCVRCASYLNTGATTDGFTINQSSLYNCVSYGNGRHGFASAGGSDNVYVNCVAEGNTGNGFVASVGGVRTSGEARISCAAFNNTAGNTLRTYRIDYGFITGTASFFTDPTNGNFSLNALAGGGALLRGAGYPTTVANTPLSINIGLGQTASSGGSGGGSSTILGPGSPGWTG